MKKSLIFALLFAGSIGSYAQSGTNSPYSQFGFGAQAEQTSGFNRGMNGLGLGFRDGKQINFLNPASYAAMDSLTFIFDVGISGQVTNFEENGKRVNARNANFEYAVAGFRAFKHLGVSFGILPYTNVGYSYASTNDVGDASNTKYTNTYSGSGGIHQAYLGFGWEPFKGFALGVNGAYLWGDYDRSIVNSYSDNAVNTLSKFYTAEITSYKVDFGAQVTIPFSKKTTMTMGVDYGMGHQLGTDPECKVISNNAQTGVADTVQTNGKAAYGIKEDYFDDRHKVTLGGEYCKNPNARGFFQRIKYRVGASYATPYLNINGKEGPKEISVSAGLGIPITNVWNNRSTLNISGQWVRMAADGLLKENSFRINLGITFNERWFMKWKVD